MLWCFMNWVKMLAILVVSQHVPYRTMMLTSRAVMYGSVYHADHLCRHASCMC